jgi:galactokinase
MTRLTASELVEHLGLDEEAAQDKARLFAQAAEALGARGPARAVCGSYVPGRIEVFGKHTDYAGGRSLLCAATRAMCALSARRQDRLVTITDAVAGVSSAFDLETVDPSALVGWIKYPAAVAGRLRRNFAPLRQGVDLVIASDLPRASGMSSSSAFIVTTLLALAWSNDLQADDRWMTTIEGPLDLAAYAACVENGSSFRRHEGETGVGTSGGSEDHTAMLCGAPGQLVQYAFVPPRHERSVPLSADVVFLVAMSGIAAEKTGPARERYNAVSARARRLLALWRQATGRADDSLAAAVTSGPDAPDQFRALVVARGGEEAVPLLERLQQFVLESTILVEAGAAAFARRDWEMLREMARQSHAAADRLLGNQVPETNGLVAAALDVGALAASAFGAGFGGSVWALAPRDSAPEIQDRWRQAYAHLAPHAMSLAQFFPSGAGPAARTFEL